MNHPDPIPVGLQVIEPMIEAGTRCEQGLVVSARRRDAVRMNLAA
jgi:hypothetical protein